MRIFTLSLLAGILFAVGGALAGLAISALLIELNCLADPGGVAVVFLLVVARAFVGGFYGFVYAKFKFQSRPPIEIRRVRHVLILACLGVSGGFLLLNALAILATFKFHSANSPYTISLIWKLVGLGLLFFGGFYGILAYGRRTGTLLAGRK
jgi:hypothetical protein